MSDKRRVELEASGFTYTTFGRDLMQVNVRTTVNKELGPVLERDEGGLNRVPDEDSSAWRTPDREMTLEQERRMLDRALAFEPYYQKVYDTGEPVSFRYDGRTYTFKPSNHLEQAWAYHRRLISNLRLSLGLAA